MPQMAPMSWLTLMLFFIMITLIFSLMNFSIKGNPTKVLSLEKKSLSKTWKW
uniref:ATP synthase complex subunit 8 n=1 Tax=Lucanus liuyei TaxID=2952596 RepID=A0AB38ZGF0_9SCAR